jgi:hypothetical protein
MTPDFLHPFSIPLKTPLGGFHACGRGLGQFFHSKMAITPTMARSEFAEVVWLQILMYDCRMVVTGSRMNPRLAFQDQPAGSGWRDSLEHFGDPFCFAKSERYRSSFDLELNNIRPLPSVSFSSSHSRTSWTKKKFRQTHDVPLPLRLQKASKPFVVYGSYTRLPSFPRVSILEIRGPLQHLLTTLFMLTCVPFR